MRSRKLTAVFFLAAIASSAASAAVRADQTLLNVSYDPTRRFFADVGKVFAEQWRAAHGERITIYQSHGGSGKQARSVVFGLEADVVTLGLAYDIDAISRQAKLLPPDWHKRLPDNSAPYTSTIVFLVRKGNPKRIFDWGDLVRPDVTLITPNPKTSGGARWNHMAAWGYALREYGNDESKARDYLTRLYRNVLVLDTGARGATITFTRRNLGDVLIAWETDALLAANEVAKGEYEVVVPKLSILAEPPVAVVDKVVDKRGTRVLAESYLKFLYSPEGQELAARHYFRPRLAAAAERFPHRFAALELMTIDQFGGWADAQKAHFADGGIFDQIYQPGS